MKVVSDSNSTNVTTLAKGELEQIIIKISTHLQNTAISNSSVTKN